MSLRVRPAHILPLDLIDPLAALRSLSGMPGAFLLHGGATFGGNWSFFGADPYATFRGGAWQEPRDAWRAAVRARSDAQSPPLATSRDSGVHPHAAPFQGGVVGYWSYDFGRRFERLPAIAADDLGFPDFVLGFYDVTGAIEHATGRAWLFATGLPLSGPAADGRARRRLAQFSARLAVPPAHTAPRVADAAAPKLAIGTFTRDRYVRAIECVQEHIRAGDIFQANLSQRWTVRTPLEAGAASRRLQTDALRTRALDLVHALALRSPAPASAYIDAGDHVVVSASPERFLEVRGRTVRTRPIKGTRPRGASSEEDARLAAELLASAKDRAENVMIVDVLRNDLGRVCAPGSVVVPELCALEEFAQVFHLTSTVEGMLAPERDALDLFEASFPGGSITGAPKLRAMEILETLEPVRRHVYTGAIGYLDWSGDADWSIAIRTALLHGDAVHWNAGGGITADSDPESEHQETLDKGLGMRLALEDLMGPIELAAVTSEVAR